MSARLELWAQTIAGARGAAFSICCIECGAAFRRRLEGDERLRAGAAPFVVAHPALVQVLAEEARQERARCQWCHPGEGLAGLENVGKAYEALGLLDERRLRGGAA